MTIDCIYIISSFPHLHLPFHLPNLPICPHCLSSEHFFICYDVIFLYSKVVLTWVNCHTCCPSYWNAEASGAFEPRSLRLPEQHRKAPISKTCFVWVPDKWVPRKLLAVHSGLCTYTWSIFWGQRGRVTKMRKLPHDPSFMNRWRLLVLSLIQMKHQIQMLIIRWPSRMRKFLQNIFIII